MTQPSRGRYSDRDLLDALRAAATAEGEPLSVERYERFRRDHGGPTSARVIQRLGSWNAACSAAGLTVRAAVAGKGRGWTAAEVVPYVAAYLGEGRGDSYAGYLAWARQASGAPSAQTVRNLWGSWDAAKRAARDASG